MKIFAIESSCDDTAAAVVEDGRKVLSSVVASQVFRHVEFGGVVPEIAGRMHCEAVSGVVREALAQAQTDICDIDAVAVTAYPGLIGSLLVGVNFAKGLALTAGKPLIPVHHLRGHIAANYISHPELKPPFLCLVVSGGHSHIVEVNDYTSMRIIGRTRKAAIPTPSPSRRPRSAARPMISAFPDSKPPLSTRFTICSRRALNCRARIWRRPCGSRW